MILFLGTKSLVLIIVQVIPVDKTGNFDMIYSFLKENWKIAKWFALGAVVFEVKVEQLCIRALAFTSSKNVTCYCGIS